MLGIFLLFSHQNCCSRGACSKNAIKPTIGVTNRTYLCTPPTGLPLTSHDWDSIDIRGTDHCCTIVVVVVVRPIVCDVTRMGLNQLFVGLAFF